MSTLLWIVGAVAIFLIWRFILSTERITDAERGVVTFCGQAVRVTDDSPVFVAWTGPLKLWGLTKLKREPIVVKSTVEGLANDGPGGRPIEVQAAGTVQLTMPSVLTRVRMFLASRITEERAKYAFEAATREEITQRDWWATNVSPEVFRSAVEARLQQDADLVSAGFDPAGIKVKFTAIKTPESHRHALTHRASASAYADADLVEGTSALDRIIKNQLQVLARSTGRTIAEVRTHLKATVTPTTPATTEWDKFYENCQKILRAGRIGSNIRPTVVLFPGAAVVSKPNTLPPSGKGKGRGRK